MKFKDWLGVGIVIAVGLLLLGGGGCSSKAPYLKAQYVQTGPCFTWGGVEKGRAKAQYFCHVANPKIEGVYCNRQEGHKGRHHSHFGRNCLSVWK